MYSEAVIWACNHPFDPCVFSKMHVTCVLLLLCGLRSAVVGQELDLSHLAVLYADATYCDPAKLLEATQVQADLTLKPWQGVYYP